MEADRKETAVYIMFRIIVPNKTLETNADSASLRRHRSALR
jgi:hypothetical protein